MQKPRTRPKDVWDAGVDHQHVEALMSGVGSVTPGVDESGRALSSYALTAACAVLEMLEYLKDSQTIHICNISSQCSGKDHSSGDWKQKSFCFRLLQPAFAA